MSEQDKRDKKIIIYVIEEEKENNNDIIIKSKDIICKECKEPCRIEIEDYKIKLYECPNNHMNDNIKLIDFDNTQNINISKIKCQSHLRYPILIYLVMNLMNYNYETYNSY